MIGPGSSENRTRYIVSSVVLASIFQATTTHLRPATIRGLPWGAPCRGSGETTRRVGRKRTPAQTNVHHCSGKAHAAPRRCESGGKGSWFGGADPECRPNNANCKCKRVGDPFTARRTVHPVRLIHHRDDPTSTANRLVSDDLLHFESSKRSRNVVLSDVVRGGFHGEIVGTYWVNPAGNTSACRHSSEGWHRACSVVPKRTGEHPRRACRRVDPSIGA